MHILSVINKPQPLKGDILQDTLVSDFQRTVSLSNEKVLKYLVHSRQAHKLQHKWSHNDITFHSYWK